VLEASKKGFSIARFSPSIQLFPEAFRDYVGQRNVDRFPGFQVRNS
jgi:hypothetical protein